MSENNKNMHERITIQRQQMQKQNKNNTHPPLTPETTTTTTVLESVETIREKWDDIYSTLGQPITQSVRYVSVDSL